MKLAVQYGSFLNRDNFGHWCSK